MRKGWGGLPSRSALIRRTGAARRTAAFGANRAVGVIPGFTRRAGFYQRYGRAARSVGLRPEKKFFDTALSFSFDTTMEASTSAATGDIVLIPQGDTESTRDGRECVIKSVQIRGTIIFAPGAGTVAQATGYLYLVLDTQANGANPAITDIFTAAAANNNMLNLANSGRFRVLKKWTINLKSSAGVSTAFAPVSIPLEYYKRCNIKMQFSSTTGAVTEIRSNNLILAFGSDTTVDDLISFTGTSRVRFMG